MSWKERYVSKVNYNDIVGKTFNKLTVVKYLGLKEITYKSSDDKIRTMNRAIYLCKCSCGNENYITDRHSLIRTDGKGNKSCGTCVQRDILGKTFGSLTVVEFIGYKKAQMLTTGVSVAAEEKLNQEDHIYYQVNLNLVDFA